MKPPVVPLDAQDRRLVGMAFVIVISVICALILVAGAAGLAVRVFVLAAWGG